MFGYLMMSWHLASEERTELSWWNKKTFFFVSQVLSFRYKKQTNRNLADTTFKYYAIALQDLDLMTVKSVRKIVYLFIDTISLKSCTCRLKLMLCYTSH